MKITTVLFDFDGTLADTIPGIVATMAAVKEEMKVDFSLTEAQSLIGKPLVEMGTALLGAQNTAEFVNTYFRLFPDYGGKMIKFFKGAEDLLQELNSLGLDIAIVTSKRKDSLMSNLNTLKAHDYFALLVANESTTFHKPHPAPVEFAINYLGKNPKECIMVGDTKYDLLAAMGAQIESIGVTWGAETAEEIKTSHPTYTANSMDELKKLILSKV